MRIAGVYPIASLENADVRGGVSEPLGLGRVLAVAQRAGAEVAYHMLIGESGEEMAALLEPFDPDVVAFSLTTAQMPVATAIAKCVKDSRRDRLVVAGGYHPSIMQRAEPPFDAFFAGEGEHSFESFVSTLRSGGDWTRGPGLILPDSPPTPRSPRIANLDDLPWALRSETILQEKYPGLADPPPSQQTGYAYIDFGRGCYMDCNFCCKSTIWGNKLTFRDPGDVVREMVWLRAEKGVNLFAFSDLNFTASARHVHALCDEMRRQRLDARWFCLSNISTAKTAVLEDMASAGCMKIMYGVESVVDDTLHRIDKRQDFALEMGVLKQTLELGMIPHVFYMIGFPWETPSDIKAALERIVEIPGLQIRVQIVTPLPGSAWYDEMRAVITASDYSLFDCEHLVYRHEHFTEAELRGWIDRIYKEFYESPHYRQRMTAFRSRFPQYAAGFSEFANLLMRQRGIQLPVGA